jgi:zinc protease
MKQMEFFVKRYLLVLLLVCSLVAPTSLASQRAARPQASKQAPRPAAAVPAPAPTRTSEESVVTKTLPNGLEIIVLEDHSIPLVTVEMAFRNGSYTEPPELNGLSHLYEHMFFKANRASLEGEDYLRTIDQLGIIYNGQTQEEVVEYYFTTTTPMAC